MSRAPKLTVLTRSESGNHAWAPHLRALGLPVYELPTIQTVPVTLTPAARITLSELPDFDWILFTSGNGVRYLHALVADAGFPWPPDGSRMAVIGTQTKRTAEAAGLSVGFQPTKRNSAVLASELPGVSGKRVLIPRTTLASNELPALLTKRGAIVTTLPVYETHTIDTPDDAFLEKLRAGEIGPIVFSSPSAVRGFCSQIAEKNLLTAARALPVVAIGPRVAEVLEATEFRHIHISPRPSIDGIVETIQQLVE